MKYYDHDSDWQDRRERRYPYWGPQSKRVYDQVVALLRAEQVAAAGWAIDVGCGAGAFGKWLEDMGYSYVGLDASAVAIQLGQKDFPQLELHQHDLVESPFPLQDRSPAQLVCSINALHCLVEKEHRQSFLQHLKMLGQDGSYLLLSTMCAPYEVGLRFSKKPRAYLEASDIMQELRQVGVVEFLKVVQEAPKGRNKVSNLMILAKL